MNVLAIKGARQHNLKGIDCELPRDRLVVITGPSGSGKSSLAFDTIYAEGQRRYVESLSAAARQFLEQLPKPDVDSIDGLSPAIAIEQKSLGRSPRSTVGTVTEISDYLRLLFARAGTPHCPKSGMELRAMTVQQMVDSILERPEGSKVAVLAPIRHKQVGDLTESIHRLRQDGFVRARLDGVMIDLAEEVPTSVTESHSLDVVVDRIVIKASIKGRLTDSVELATKLGAGTVFLDALDGTPDEILSERLISWEHGIEVPALEPKLFSFNSPFGACPRCNGLGSARRASEDLMVPDPALTLRAGAIAAFGARGSVAAAVRLSDLVKALGVDADTAWKDLPETTQQAILLGGELKVKGRRKHYPGVATLLEEWLDGDDSPGDEEDDAGGQDPAQFFIQDVCTECNGQRLRAEALAVRFLGASIAEYSSLPLTALRDKLAEPAALDALSAEKRFIAAPLVESIAERLSFLIDVGLGYLTLGRASLSLSSGERQRIRLATQIGASLVGVLYVLDEPSVGLHAKDNSHLLAALRKLVDRGNSVIVVEHERDTIAAADYVIDLGPGAGEHGGRIVAQGTPKDLMESPTSITGPYLNGARTIKRGPPRKRGKQALRVVNATTNNLNNLTVEFPLGVLTAVTGVSGSGKSSLVMDTLLSYARQGLFGARARRHSAAQIVQGLDNIDKVVGIDQTPIGRSPRSNTATFTGIFAALRELYAATPEARSRGYNARRFSFNVKGGRCEACQGDGARRVEMHFLPDVFVVCEQCNGRRYNRETLEVKYRGYSIADILEMSVDDASPQLEAIPRIRQKLEALQTVGLGYLRLGQPGTTLSGGEAQRVKLATELSRRATGKTLYVLDEPTTGLHFRDVELLFTALDALAEAGNTVVFIEHNLDLVAAADWVIDIGPDGGDRGGTVVAEGTPEQVARSGKGHTAAHLALALGA